LSSPIETGGPLHVNSLALQYKKLIKLANLPVIRFHDLRRTSATLLLAQGVHAKIVQERLGEFEKDSPGLVFRPYVTKM